MIRTVDLFEEIGRVLNSLFDLEEVTAERIQKIQFKDSNDRQKALPLMSIELVTYESPVFNQTTVNKTITVDIIYFSKGNTVAEALEVLEALNGAFSMGLFVKDRFIHTSGKPDSHLEGQDLHYLVTFDFKDEYKPLMADVHGNVRSFNTNINNANPNIFHTEDDFPDRERDTDLADILDKKIEREKIELMQDIYQVYKVR